MIKNNNPYIEGKQSNIELLNKALGKVELTFEENQSLLWLSTRDGITVKNVIAAFEKSSNEKIAFERSSVKFEELERRSN